MNSIYDFTYEKIIQKVRSIDVFWFNERNFPLYVFEIEHTTDFRNSLLKFLELRDFKINMKIVSPIERMKGYESKIKFSSFEPIRDQVKFISYDSVSNWHSKTYELMLTEQKIMG